MSFFSDFINSARNTQRLFSEQQAMQNAEDANRRANEDAQRKTDADAREAAMAEELSRVQDAYTPTAGSVQGGAGELATDRLNGMMTQKDKMLRAADIAMKNRNFKLANEFRDDARAFGTHELDLRIKQNNAIAGEADNKAGIIQSIGDQGSFDNALYQLQRSGFSKEAMFLLQQTDGVYTPDLQPVIDSFVKASMSGKEAMDLDRALLKDARDATNQKDLQRHRELTATRANESFALRREKQNQVGQPKPISDSEIRQEHKVLKDEVNSESFQDEYARLEELISDGEATASDRATYTKMKASLEEVNDFKKFKASRRAGPFEAHPGFVPGATAGRSSAELKAILAARRAAKK